MSADRTKNPHQSFHIEGVTDYSVFVSQAEYRARKYGESTIIHRHKHGQPCRGECVVKTPEEEKDE